MKGIPIGALISAAVLVASIIGGSYVALDHIQANRADIDRIEQTLEAHRIDAAAKEAVDETFNDEIARLRALAHSH